MDQASSIALPLADGARALVLPAAGRLLGLFAAGSDDNFLWTNPAPGGAWPNPGGDRTWLAPEMELFMDDAGDGTSTYRVPAALDPGNWRLHGPNRLVSSARLRLRRSGREAPVRLEKEFRPADNPLPGADLQYAGYTQITRLETDAPLGIWNLLQLPSGGEMLVATHGTARPATFFGVLGGGEVSCEPGLMRWRMVATGQDTKIALKAAAVTGRAGYLRPGAQPGMMDLVVREFAVDPAGNYVDSTWEPPHETGWAFQACRVLSLAGGFNELEYHAPLECRCDESRVWGFRGAVGDVMGAAARLLGCPVGEIGKEQRHG